MGEIEIHMSEMVGALFGFYFLLFFLLLLTSF